MRIAIFAEYYYPFISGVVTHIETLSDGLRAAGHEVLIVTLDPNAKKHYRKDNVLYCPAIGLKKVYGYGVSNPINRMRLKIIEKFNPDVIHLQTEFTMGLFALHCAKKLNKPIVYTLHTMYDDYMFYVVPKHMVKMAKPIAHAYLRKVASKAHEIMGPSHKVAEYLRTIGVKKQVNVVPNTVDLTAFLAENVDAARVADKRGELGLTANSTALCFVGRLGGEKSIDVLIDLFKQSFAGEKDFKLFIVGDGPEKETLKSQIETLGMHTQIKMLGRIEHEDLPVFYQACDLFATASLSEMNSISLLEATASGLYAVHRLDVYNLDQIRSGVNGDVFTTREEFEEIVRSHAALSSEEKQQCKQKVCAYACRYGREDFTQAVLNVYERAIAKHKGKSEVYLE